MSTPAGRENAKQLRTSAKHPVTVIRSLGIRDTKIFKKWSERLKCRGFFDRIDQNTPRRGGRRHGRNAKPTKFAFIKRLAQGLRRLVWRVCRASFQSLRRERVPHANATARGANECGGSAFLEFCRRNCCPRGRAGILRPPVGTIRLCSVHPFKSILGADGCDRRFCNLAERGGRTAVFLYDGFYRKIVGKIILFFFL